MAILKDIILRFDNNNYDFINKLMDIFSNVTVHYENSILFKKSNNEYLPNISIENFSKGLETTTATFLFDDKTRLQTTIKNKTGLNKFRPNEYIPIEIDDFKSRLDKFGITITKIDHIGFNLPWFKNHIHPEIIDLRKALSLKSFYHTYPTGEPWDFILPATTDEIIGNQKANYKKIRKPKFEIVSFNKSSIPIIQFDVCCSIKKESLKTYFPEGIYDEHLHNSWIYLKNPTQIDICLVIGEDYEGDWSNYFENYRLNY